MKRLLTDAEVAEVLGCSRSKLMQLRKNGLPFIRVGGSIRYDQEQLQLWLDSQGKSQQTGGK